MKTITSRDNFFFRQAKKLVDSSRERRKMRQTLLDGAHLLATCLDAGYLPENILLTERGTQNPEILRLLTKMPTVELTRLSDALFTELSPVETPSGVLAVIGIPQPQLPPRPELCLLLEDIQDPGNLGTLLRSAAAAGVQVAWLSTGCADAWAPKALRAGMGAHFVLVVEERVNLVEKASDFLGVTLATSLSATQSLYDLDLTGPMMLIVGNEGAGVSVELQAAASKRVRIPMPGRVESLNVAAAASICLFERVRQMEKND